MEQACSLDLRIVKEHQACSSSECGLNSDQEQLPGRAWGTVLFTIKMKTNNIFIVLITIN